VLGRLVAEVFPLSHQEIARDRHADLLREAKQERLAALLREDAPARTSRLGEKALRWASSVTRRQPAVHTA